MTLRHLTLGTVAIAAAILLAACTGSTASSPPTGTTAAGSVAPAAGGASSGGGGGGLPGGACALLSTAEIGQALGLPVDAGKEQDSDGQVYCEWAATGDDTVAVGLTVATYDDVLWQTGSASSQSTKVDGLGEAAFKGWPTAEALNIKAKGDAITVGVTDFKLDQSKIDAINETLAKLVLSRL